MNVLDSVISVLFMTIGTGMCQDKFDLKDYAGYRPSAIVKMYYSKRLPGWIRQPPACYGVLIDWMKAVVPCTCVSFAKDEDTASPWHHPRPAKAVTQISVDIINVGLMSEEKDPAKSDNKVPVRSIEIAKGCDSSYLINYALLTLVRKIPGSRLMWVNSPIKRELQAQIDKISIGSAIGGECVVMRWIQTVKKRGGKLEPELKAARVKFQHWDMCLPNVCPSTRPPNVAKTDIDDKVCFNNGTHASRYCITWREDVSLCNVLPGSPVMCDLGNIRGIMGIIYNTTFYCPETQYFNGVMNGFVDALDLIQDSLRIGQSPVYKAVLRSMGAGRASRFFPQSSAILLTTLALFVYDYPTFLFASLLLRTD